MAPLEHGACPALEVVQAELVETREPWRTVMARMESAPGATSTVRGSGPSRSPSAYATMPGAARLTRCTVVRVRRMPHRDCR